MSFFDLTDNFVKHKSQGGGLDIVFSSVATGMTTSFKAFITSWEDTFKQDWKPYDSFGRMDSIRIYQKTSRQLNFNIDIPSASPAEAASNFASIQSLIQMSYPMFEEIKIKTNNNSNTQATSQTASNRENEVLEPNYKVIGSIMGSPPFFNVKFSNFALDNSNTFPFSGLYGVIENIKFSPDFSVESGGFYGNQTLGMKNATTNYLVPKSMKLSISMIVIHVEKLGFRSNAETNESINRNPNFPYNAAQIAQASKQEEERTNTIMKEKIALLPVSTNNKQSLVGYLTKTIGDKFNDLSQAIAPTPF